MKQYLCVRWNTIIDCQSILQRGFLYFCSYVTMNPVIVGSENNSMEFWVHALVHIGRNENSEILTQFFCFFIFLDRWQTLFSFMQLVSLEPQASGFQYSLERLLEYVLQDNIYP